MGTRTNWKYKWKIWEDNPEDTIEIESKLNEMHNKFESSLNALSSKLEKMDQEEEELKKKMKDNIFYG